MHFRHLSCEYLAFNIFIDAPVSCNNLLMCSELTLPSENQICTHRYRVLSNIHIHSHFNVPPSNMDNRKWISDEGSARLSSRERDFASRINREFYDRQLDRAFELRNSNSRLSNEWIYVQVRREHAERLEREREAAPQDWDEEGKCPVCPGNKKFHKREGRAKMLSDPCGHEMCKKCLDETYTFDMPRRCPKPGCGKMLNKEDYIPWMDEWKPRSPPRPEPTIRGGIPGLMKWKEDQDGKVASMRWKQKEQQRKREKRSERGRRRGGEVTPQEAKR